MVVSTLNLVETFIALSRSVGQLEWKKKYDGSRNMADFNFSWRFAQFTELN